MSFLSKLVSFIPVVGPAISGGIDAIGAIKDASNVAGKAGAAAGSARQTDTQNILQQQQLKNQAYGTQQGAEMQAGNLNLAQKNFGEQARGGRAHQALLASILGGGFKPTEINVPGIKNASVTGGLAASLNNPGAQASMAELMKQALAAQIQQGSPEGEQFAGGKVLAPPPMAALPQAGKMENIMGGVGLGGSLLSSILANIKKSSEGGD